MLTLFQVTGGSIDKDAGVISGVCVITGGVEALGHGVYTDDTTLSSVKQCADTMTGGVRVKMDHYSGFGEIVGVLKNFRIENGEKHNCLRADLHLLKKHPAYEQIVEMSEAIPESFGLSIAFSGTWETVDGLEFARCSELYSVDLVDRPAANPNGLFSVDCSAFANNKFMSTVKEFAAKLAEFSESFKSLFTAKQDDAAVTELKSQLTAIETAVSEKLSAAETQITELQAKNKTLSESATAITTSLDSAITALKLEAKAGATDSEKIQALQDGVAATIAKLNVKPSEIPAAPIRAEAKTKQLSRAEFEKLNFAQRNDFIRSGGKLTE